MSRFFRLLKATLYKEWKTLLSRGLAGLVGFVFVAPGVMLGKVLSVADAESLSATSGALFAIFEVYSQIPRTCL